jgi:hypothetical protein
MLASVLCTLKSNRRKQSKQETEGMPLVSPASKFTDG